MSSEHPLVEGNGVLMSTPDNEGLFVQFDDPDLDQVIVVFPLFPDFVLPDLYGIEYV